MATPSKSGSVWQTRAERLWPDLPNLPPAVRSQLTMVLIPLAWMTPLVPLAFAWLVRVTDWALFAAHWPLWLVLLAAQIFLSQRAYTLILNLNPASELRVISSLSSLVEWSAVLIFGPSGIWLAWLAGVVRACWDLLRRPAGAYTLWTTASTLVQTIGSNIAAALISVSAYQAAGGGFPLALGSAADWGAVAVLLATQTLAPFALSLPVLFSLNRFNGVPNSVGALLRLGAGFVPLTFINTAFAVPLALTYLIGDVPLYLAFLVGALLVGTLINYLSRANVANRQRSLDLARLQRLSGALLEAPADGSTLAAVLRGHVPAILPFDQVEIRLGPPATHAPPHRVGDFSLRLPSTAPPPADTIWEDMFARSETAGFAQEGVAQSAAWVKIFTPGPDGRPRGRGAIFLRRQLFTGSAEAALPVLQDLAAQIGAALVRAEAFAETTAREKLTRELEIAGRIQATFLPVRLPEPPGWRIAAHLEPARQTSGDFFDVIELDGARLALVVADVADKGTGAALYMALSRTLIRTYAFEHPGDPARVLAAANTRILQDTAAEQFVTVFYAVLDTRSGELAFANAGHNPPLLAGNGVPASEEADLGQTGPPLGILPGETWRSGRVALRPGDTLVIYTDGVTEAHNETGGEFGLDRLRGLVQLGAERPIEELRRMILSGIARFTGAAPQFDDMTLLLVRRENGETGR